MAYDVFFMAAQTGMRAGEILALDWDHVDVENRIIYIHQAWKTRTVIEPPKWDKEREIYITNALYEQISNLQKVNKLLFCYENGIRLGQTGGSGALYLRCKRLESIIKQGILLPIHSGIHLTHTLYPPAFVIFFLFKPIWDGRLMLNS